MNECIEPGKVERNYLSLLLTISGIKSKNISSAIIAHLCDDVSQVEAAAIYSIHRVTINKYIRKLKSVDSTLVSLWESKFGVPMDNTSLIIQSFKELRPETFEMICESKKFSIDIKQASNTLMVKALAHAQTFDQEHPRQTVKALEDARLERRSAFIKGQLSHDSLNWVRNYSL